MKNDKVLTAVKAMSKDNFGSVIIVDKSKKGVRNCNRKRLNEKTIKQFYESVKLQNLRTLWTSPVKVADKDDQLTSSA